MEPDKPELVPSEWNMQNVMATMGYPSKPIGQSFDEANAVYLAFCPWEEFEKVSAIGYGPKAAQAIHERRLSKAKPKAPEQLKKYCQVQADKAIASFKAQEDKRGKGR